MSIIKPTANGYALYNPLNDTKYIELDTTNGKVVSHLPFSTDDGTIGGDPIVGMPSSGSDASVALGGGWTTENANQPVTVQFEVAVETDGTTRGLVLIEVDDSGGTTADFGLPCRVPPRKRVGR